MELGNKTEREGAIFRPHSCENPQPIFMKFEIYNYFRDPDPDTTPHAKFSGVYVDMTNFHASNWLFVQTNSQFDAWKFVIFSFLQDALMSHLSTHPTTIRHYTSFSLRKCLIRDRKIKFEIWPSLPPKNVKIVTKLAVNGICNRPNSETTSHILLKLGTETKVASHDMTLRSRGQR